MFYSSYAESGVDYRPFNNMTAGESSRAVLTPPRPSACFSISLLTRQDDGLDDRNFFVSVMLRDGMATINPPAEQIQLPEDLEITIQPCENYLLHFEPGGRNLILRLHLKSSLSASGSMCIEPRQHWPVLCNLRKILQQIACLILQFLKKCHVDFLDCTSVEK